MNNNAKQRFFYLDHVRIFVIFLVVVMHSNVTYSGMGGWYYIEGCPDQLDIVSKIFFGFYGCFVQAWFMGILFFISGYLVVKSLSSKGTFGFIKERLFRLCIPLIIYMFVIDPLIVYFIVKNNSSNFYTILGFPQYYKNYIGGLYFIGATGPLWFVEVLLVLSIIYALYRKFKKLKYNKTDITRVKWKLIVLIVITALAAFCIRLVYPIGSSFYNLQFGYFASYIVLFILGIHSAEQQWYDYMVQHGLVFFKAALGIGIPAWSVIMIAGGALTGDIPMMGGLYWQTAAYALWESFVAICMTFGLLAFFYNYFSREQKWTRNLSSHSFGIYMFHAPVLTGISVLSAGLVFPMLVKHLLIAPLAYAATYVMSVVLRRVPPIREITR